MPSIWSNCTAASGQSVASTSASRRGHLVEGLLARQLRQREELLLHGPGAVVAAALLDHLDGGARDQPHHVARAEADVLRLQVAGQVVGDLLRRRAEVAVELAFLLELEQELAQVHARPRRLPWLRACPPVRGIPCASCRSRSDRRPGSSCPRARAAAARRRCCAPCCRASSMSPGFERRACRSSSVSGSRSAMPFVANTAHGVLADLRVVVVHEAGDEQRPRARRRPRAPAACGTSPSKVSPWKSGSSFSR